MPSVVLRLRADGDGDGYADIWSNELDGLASIANYLRDAGWKPNVALGRSGAHARQPQPRRARSPHHCAALPASLSPPQPVADHRVSGARSASSRSGAGCRTARWRR